MATKTFDRDAKARWYAQQHLKIDPGVRAIYYLPSNSPEREIRLLEVNDQISEFADAELEPFDFNVDFDQDDEHALFVLDVTPNQWDRIKHDPSLLPSDWSLSDTIEYSRTIST